MKKFLGILSYVKPYWGKALLNAIFNILGVFFNLFSISMVIPMLALLFENAEPQPAAQGEWFSKDAILSHFFYLVYDVFGAADRADALGILCILIVSTFLLKNLFLYLALYFVNPVRTGVIRDIRSKIYNKLLGLPVAYFTEERKGDLMSRMSHDLNEIEWSVLTSLEAIVRDPVSIMVLMAVLLFISPQLTVFLFILIPLGGILIGRVGKSIKKYATRGQEKMGALYSVIEETLSGLRVIKGFNAEGHMAQRFDELNNNHRSINTTVFRRQSLASPLSEFIGAIIIAIVVWYGGKIVLDENLEPSFFIGFIAFFSQIIPPAKALTTTVYNAKRGIAAIERVNKVLDAENNITEKSDAASISDFSDSIVYQDVSFSYGTEEVLKNINITIPKGKMVALVGPSGAGKTTFADILPRFHDVQKGQVLLDGKDIKDYRIKDLRSLLGIVTQQSILFNDTVFNNIAFGDEKFSEDQVISAAKVANAHEFIEKMDKGYQTNIGEGGSKLSGGQRQRLSIARAVLKNPPILILDEATSALDTESERLVQDALFNLMKDRTSIVIAHRLSTIQAADMIVVLDQGQIKETGTHAELLEKGGLYRKLYELQSFG